MGLFYRQSLPTLVRGMGKIRDCRTFWFHQRPTIAILFFRLFQTEKIERGKPPDCVKTQSLVGDSVPKPLGKG